MQIKSENFHMTLWNWDWLCLWQVSENYDWWQNFWWFLCWEEFLIEIANFAINLAEKNLKYSNEMIKAVSIAENHYRLKLKQKFKIKKTKKWMTEINIIN